ncbi:MAG: site-specific DNA-methyltransferase [Acidimicrobiaceae bacterium]|nr:site-specific DNA-methyltransferase [Acidimicrobiaceae bacterium]
MAESNWAHQTIWTGDNLPIMRGMNAESVDLIYLDPPFNSKADYAAPIGSKAAGAEFTDTWTLTDIDVEWINLLQDRHPALWRVLLAAMTPSDKSYLAYMAVRLIELHRILRNDGSLWLHCDPTMSHYLKLLLDAIFGRGQFRNEIIWRYPKYSPGKHKFGSNFDQLLFYAKDVNKFTPQTEDRDKPVRQLVRENVDGVLRNKRGPDGELIYRTSTTRNVAAVWDMSIVMPASKDYLGYPTQKPLGLLQRIIAASSDPGDMVLDPFCGCATTLVAAHDLTRNWAGIDISAKAAELVTHRITERQGLFSGIVHRTDLPQRTDLGTPPPLLLPRQPRSALRQPGRTLRRLPRTLPDAEPHRGPHHRHREGRHRPSRQPPAPLRPLQQRQRRPRHGVPAESAPARLSPRIWGLWATVYVPRRTGVPPHGCSTGLGRSNGEAAQRPHRRRVPPPHRHREQTHRGRAAPHQDGSRRTGPGLSRGSQAQAPQRVEGRLQGRDTRAGREGRTHVPAPGPGLGSPPCQPEYIIPQHIRHPQHRVT